MDSIELYRQLLGLSTPWTVERVELDMAKQHVEVHVGHAPGQRFGVPAEVELTTTEARQTFTWWTEEQITLGEVSTDAAGLGGWTPTIWHSSCAIWTRRCR